MHQHGVLGSSGLSSNLLCAQLKLLKDGASTASADVDKRHVLASETCSFGSGRVNRKARRRRRTKTPSVPETSAATTLIESSNLRRAGYMYKIVYRGEACAAVAELCCRAHYGLRACANLTERFQDGAGSARLGAPVVSASNELELAPGGVESTKLPSDGGHPRTALRAHWQREAQQGEVGANQLLHARIGGVGVKPMDPGALTPRALSRGKEGLEDGTHRPVQARRQEMVWRRMGGMQGGDGSGTQWKNHPLGKCQSQPAPARTSAAAARSIPKRGRGTGGMRIQRRLPKVANWKWSEYGAPLRQIELNNKNSLELRRRRVGGQTASPEATARRAVARVYRCARPARSAHESVEAERSPSTVDEGTTATAADVVLTAAVTETWRRRARRESAAGCAALGGESEPEIGSHTETRSYAGRNVVFSRTSYVVDDARRSRLNEALQPTNYKKVVIYILSQRLWSAQTSCEYLVVKTVPSQSLPALESPFPSQMIAAPLIRAWIESRHKTSWSRSDAVAQAPCPSTRRGPPVFSTHRAGGTHTFTPARWTQDVQWRTRTRQRRGQCRCPSRVLVATRRMRTRTEWTKRQSNDVRRATARLVSTGVVRRAWWARAHGRWRGVRAHWGMLKAALRAREVSCADGKITEERRGERRGLAGAIPPRRFFGVVCPPRRARVGSTCGGSDGRRGVARGRDAWNAPRVGAGNEGGALDLTQSRTSIEDDAQLSARTARRLRRDELCLVALGAGESAKRRIQSRARCGGRYRGCGQDEKKGPRGRRAIRTRRMNATPHRAFSGATSRCCERASRPRDVDAPLMRRASEAGGSWASVDSHQVNICMESELKPRTSQAQDVNARAASRDGLNSGGQLRGLHGSGEPGASGIAGASALGECACGEMRGRWREWRHGGSVRRRWRAEKLRTARKAVTESGVRGPLQGARTFGRAPPRSRPGRATWQARARADQNEPDGSPVPEQAQVAAAHNALRLREPDEGVRPDRSRRRCAGKGAPQLGSASKGGLKEGAGVGGVPWAAHSETRGARHPTSSAWSHGSPRAAVTKCGRRRLGEDGTSSPSLHGRLVR
ncbi:hypothetical protein B0H14DRAFT_2581328 [Mycena olivaceomarginata]|nr:hypothetical protein B0H14DRAFT_2581328 [Mycena olivaceomarginata]